VHFGFFKYTFSLYTLLKDVCKVLGCKYNAELGGPAQKTRFFQMVPKSFLSSLIYFTSCEYDILKVLEKKCQSPPIGCVKLLFGISGQRSF
jgi:hypothetical protein